MMPAEAHGKDVQPDRAPGRRFPHCDRAYSDRHHHLLLDIQREHFWFRGRYRLLLRVLRREIARDFGGETELSAIDLGGGCGGWIHYLHTNAAEMFHRLALADCSIKALSLAESVVGDTTDRFRIDLHSLPWEEEWDVGFLLDVLEHIPAHKDVLRQIYKSLKPGGLLFVTTPALQVFRTYNDDLVDHQRRYCKKDFARLAECTGFELLRADYFMFFLSPPLLLYRMLFPPPKSATPEQLDDHLARSHRIPRPLANKCLAGIFSLEAAMINRLSFPWGTSLLAVLKRRRVR